MVDSGLPVYLVTGVFVGFASGLLGVGGGLIIVPVLYFVFSAQGFPAQFIMHMALATSLATIIITSISSTRAHHRHGAVLWPVVKKFAAGILAGSWLGGMLATQLHSETLKPAFAAFECAVALLMLSRYKPEAHSREISAARSSFGGGVIGLVSAMVGVGGGTMTVPFLLWHGTSMRSAVATSAAVGLPIAVAGTAAYIVSGWGMELSAGDQVALTLGYVHLPAFLAIIVTSVLFAPLGARLAHSLPDARLKQAFAVFLLLIAFRLLAS